MEDRNGFSSKPPEIDLTTSVFTASDGFLTGWCKNATEGFDSCLHCRYLLKFQDVNGKNMSLCKIVNALHALHFCNMALVNLTEVFCKQSGRLHYQPNRMLYFCTILMRFPMIRPGRCPSESNDWMHFFPDTRFIIGLNIAIILGKW